MKNIVENQGIKNDKPVPLTYEQLKQRLDAVVAECAALKQVATKANETVMKSTFEYWSDRCEINQAFCNILDVETPNVTAALAEVEAKAAAAALDGVIEFIDRDSGLAEMKTQYDLSSAIVEYVQKLREGRA